MKLKADTRTNGDVNDSGKQQYDPQGIYFPGSHEDCREQLSEIHPQYQVQHAEQKARTGYFPLRDTAHDPAKGEAG